MTIIVCYDCHKEHGTFKPLVYKQVEPIELLDEMVLIGYCQTCGWAYEMHYENMEDDLEPTVVDDPNDCIH